MNPVWTVKFVKALPDFKLFLTFEKVYADGISIAWNDSLDFCPETLYEEGVDCN
jgi:hypothetical protein